MRPVLLDDIILIGIVDSLLPKGKKAIFKEHAEKNGESMNAFLLRTAEETIERESDQYGLQDFCWVLSKFKPIILSLF